MKKNAPQLPRFVVPKSMASVKFLSKKEKMSKDRRSLNRMAYDF